MFRLLRYLKTCKKEAILTPIFVLLEVVGEILIPIFMGKLIDDGIKGTNGIPPRPELVWQYSLIMVGLAIFSLISGILASRYAAVVSNQLGRNLRDAQYRKIQTYAFENIDHYSTSSLITRMTMDVSMIQNAVQMNIRIAFRAPVMIVFSIITSAIIGGNMALIFVGVTPIIGFGIWFVMKGAHPYFVKMFKKVDKLNLKVQESLIGIRTVKSYVREDYETNDFDKVTLEVSENAKKAEKWIVFNNPILQFSIGICFVLIGWFGSQRMVAGNFTEGQFANIVTYVMQVLMSLMMLSQVFLMIVISKTSAQRIEEVLTEVPVLKEIQNPVTEVLDGSFEFRDVHFEYKPLKPILKNINFKAESGSFVGIFGATGTGKTTMIQLLSRLYDVNRGVVLVGGVDTKTYQLDTLRKNVITVLQKNVLFSGTIRENMQWGKADATDEEIISNLKKAQAFEFVSKMPKGLDTWIEQGGVNVSGGQRQRLCIARALLANPKILIMDDSTSAVDTKTDALIKEALSNENKEMTKVVVAQRLSSIEKADQIIILDNEGIQAVGNHKTLYESNEIYRSVYNAQQQGKEV